MAHDKGATTKQHGNEEVQARIHPEMRRNPTPSEEEAARAPSAHFSRGI